jgi:hypothetical protein
MPSEHGARLLLAVSLVAIAPCCHGGFPVEPCRNVNCSGHGECFSNDERAACVCDPGYSPAALECVADGGDADSDTDGDADGACPPDVPFGGECDPRTQVCCAASERCSLATGATTTEVCASGSGTSGAGDLCLGGDGDCVAGTYCAQLTNGTFACLPFCSASAECPDEGLCGGLPQAAGYGVCFPGPADCDPVANTGCPDRYGCYANAGAGLCEPAGLHVVGEECADNREGCVGGTTCVGIEGDAGVTWSCRRFCRLDGDDCESPDVCADIGDATYGVCYSSP